jgi:tetratricopeptide (TPR) repeat protein
MLARKKFCWIILTAVTLILYSLSIEKISKMRRHYDPTQTVSALFVKPRFLEIVAGEFKPIVADYLLLKASVFMGGVYETKRSDLITVASLFEQSIHLDPCFFQTCYFAQNLLAWRKGMTRKAIGMLELSRKHRTWDWEPSTFIGFDYFYFLKDNIAASKYFMEAAKFSEAPLFYGIFGARLAQRGGQTEAAIEFLKLIHDKTENEENRKQIMLRIKALQGVKVLEDAIEIFYKKFERYPDEIKELVRAGILEKLPSNPYGRPYKSKGKRVEF